MELRPKEVKIFDYDLSVGTILKGNVVVYHRQEILNAGKVNHKIYGDFNVKQNNGSKHTIKFFILTDLQYLEWFHQMATTRPSILTKLSQSNISDPQTFLYSSNNAVPEGTFEIQMGKENVIYFIADNSFSSISSKNIRLTIWEKWDESILPIDVVTTTPPKDTSIDDTTQQMISSATNDLKILSPYLDMYLVKQLLQQHEKGVSISIVTRDITEVKKQKSNREALEFIHKSLGDNHRVNSLIHSRIIIRDEIDALVSSADLTQDSLRLNYNTGIILSDPNLLQKLVNYFNQAYADSKQMSTLNS